MIYFRRLSLAFAVAVALGLFAEPAFCQQPVPTVQPEQVYALVPHAEAVEVITAEGESRPISVNPASAEQVGIVEVKAGETLKVNEGESCQVFVPEAGSVHVAEKSEVKVPAKAASEDAEKADEKAKAAGAHSLELLKGKLLIDVDAEKLKETTGKQFRLKMPSSILAVRGTRFFAEVTESFDSVGVNEGTVVALEPVSGTSAEVKEGYALAVKPGQVSPPRRLTREEEELAELFDRYAVNQVAAENRGRDFESSYDIYDSDDRSKDKQDPSKIRVETVSDNTMPGSIIKMTLKPHLDLETGGNASLSLTLGKKLRQPPVAVFLMVRSTGIKEVSVGSRLTHDKVNYGDWGYRGFFLDGELDGSEWLPIMLPIYSNQDPATGDNMINVNIYMNYDPNEDTYNLKQGLKEYIVEFSPVSVITRGGAD